MWFHHFSGKKVATALDQVAITVTLNLTHESFLFFKFDIFWCITFIHSTQEGISIHKTSSLPYNGILINFITFLVPPQHQSYCLLFSQLVLHEKQKLTNLYHIILSVVFPSINLLNILYSKMRLHGT